MLVLVLVLELELELELGLELKRQPDLELEKELELGGTFGPGLSHNPVWGWSRTHNSSRPSPGLTPIIRIMMA